MYRLNMVWRRASRYEPVWPVMQACIQIVRGLRFRNCGTFEVSRQSEPARTAIARVRVERGTAFTLLEI